MTNMVENWNIGTYVSAHSNRNGKQDEGKLKLALIQAIEEELEH